ncbi:hypothetical protein [Sporolactobacillus spathodeae]|uniref:Uncharacterized protein n=1 Tax=Sporolactobacillus spathodeae TaxID=1465502 RepID=A0ABS2Q7N3_9BACL|nr:hypothetical protein [Sporolactobacillus spathodeae]MBM7657799.1 hypothetical protein [Sporolactobacillus spathodeae]
MNARASFSSSFFAALHQAHMEKRQAQWQSLTPEQQQLVQRIVNRPQAAVDRLITETRRAIDKADNA